MNLTTCPDCGRQVSKQAVSCPHCGRVMKAATNPAARMILLVIFAVVVGIVGTRWVVQWLAT